LNVKFTAIWPEISEQKDPLDSAEEWKDVAEKREHLSEAAFTG
jgi:hypothetical protein